MTKTPTVKGNFLRRQRAARNFFGRPNFGNRSRRTKTGGVKNGKSFPAHPRGFMQESFRAEVDTLATPKTRK
jgi:hypothetical protein